MPPPSQRLLDLPRLVMRRAGWVALGAWLLVLVLGLQRAQTDMAHEVAAARATAELASHLAQPGAANAPDFVPSLQRIVQGDMPRHLSLTLRDAQGQVLFATGNDAPAGAPLSWLLRLHRAWLPVHEPAAVSWALPRDGGEPWRVTLAASHESERAEAVLSLAALLALGVLGSAALLLALGLSVHRAFRPMRSLLTAIAALRENDSRALHALQPMPIGELRSIAAALQDLACALDTAEQQRRSLSRQVISLQEDERQRIARELHDEFGQRLTALRADAAWLAQRIGSDEQAARVMHTMSAQCEALQAEIRSLLARLRPLATDGAADLLGLQQLLAALVDAWNASPGQTVGFELLLRQPGHPRGWPGPEQARACAMPQELCLALYRISQEALTNVARHSGATRAQLQLTLLHDADGDALHWQVSDDGAGIASLQLALQRGNGLAGIRQRVWALGADLECDAAQSASAPGAGLRLRARFRMPALPPTRAPHAA